MEFLLTVIGVILALSFAYVFIALVAVPELLILPLALIVAYLESKQEQQKLLEEKKEES